MEHIKVSIGDFDNVAFQDIIEKMKHTLQEMDCLVEKPKTFTDQLKSDFEKASYRVVANQLLTITRNIIVQQLKNNRFDSFKLQIAGEILDSEMGEAMMGLLLGFTISQIPQLRESPRVLRILQELRVAGFTTAGNNIFEGIVEMMLPVVAEALAGIEKNKKEALAGIEKNKKAEMMLEEEIENLSEENNIVPLQRQS